MVFPTFFNLSLNLAIRSSRSEPQSAPSLVFADCIELLHLLLQRILGALAGNLLIVRFLCSLGFLLSSIGGLVVTFEHYAAYTGMEGFAAKCKMTTNFPSFLPLDDIAPFMFKAFALCNEKLDWSFLGQSMPFWILVIFMISTVIAALMFISNFVKDKVNTFVNLYK